MAQPKPKTSLPEDIRRIMKESKEELEFFDRYDKAADKEKFLTEQKKNIKSK